MRSSIDGGSIFNCLGETQFQGDFGWFSVILTVGNLSVIPFENKTIGRGRYRPVPLFLYRDGKNGISTPFFNAEKH